jgi:hypothetical protein
VIQFWRTKTTDWVEWGIEAFHTGGLFSRLMTRYARCVTIQGASKTYPTATIVSRMSPCLKNQVFA